MHLWLHCVLYTKVITRYMDISCYGTPAYSWRKTWRHPVLLGDPIHHPWGTLANGCETVVHCTKLMTYIFWGIIKNGFPVSLSLVQNVLQRSKNILSAAHVLHFRFTQYLSVTHMVMCVNWPLIVLYMSGTRAVIVFYALHTLIARALSSSGDDFHHQITFCHNFSIRFYQCDVRLRYLARCDRCFRHRIHSICHITNWMLLETDHALHKSWNFGAYNR